MSVTRLLVSAAIAAIALFLLLLSGGAHLQLQEARGLMQSGVAAEATLTEVLGGGRGGSHRYSYDYTVGTKRFEQVRRGITYDARYGSKVGDRVKVWYDPGNPAKSITRAELDTMESWANRFIFPLVGVALLAWAIVRLRRPRS